MAIHPKTRLGLSAHPARFWNLNANGKVECHLCPRHCKIPEGGVGFCQVRGTEGGELKTYNYGVSVQMTQEFIETEACNHFTPGASILSLGNIGCMMACDFCHNWQTSQVKHINKKDIHFYTPEQVVETALEKGIGMLSWTYNDPVVWQEFVVDTARLARKHGIKNLYKSAFYIGPEAIDELCEVMDIFSLSLKSMDPTFYAQITKGRLEPVLEGIKRVYQHKDKHLELSNLVVTGRNDNMPEMDKVVNWMLDNLDDEVPLHIVRFHPDFKYTHVERTSIPFLIEARERAISMGLKNVYLGNVYQENEGLLTKCRKCSNVLVKRFGLSVDSSGLDGNGHCASCGEKSSIKQPKLVERAPTTSIDNKPEHSINFKWHGDINACHLILENPTASILSFVVESTRATGASTFKSIRLMPKELWRMIASKSAADETGVTIHHDLGVKAEFLEVLDRAHFPTDATPEVPAVMGMLPQDTGAESVATV